MVIVHERASYREDVEDIDKEKCQDVIVDEWVRSASNRTWEFVLPSSEIDCLSMGIQGERQDEIDWWDIQGETIRKRVSAEGRYRLQVNLRTGHKPVVNSSVTGPCPLEGCAGD